MTYPFNFLQISNFQGDAVDYRYEFFTNPESIVFHVFGNTSTNPGLIVYPTAYKGLANNFEEIVTANSFPQCCYNNDTYKAWLAQNRGSLIAGGIGSVAAIAGGIASGVSITPGTPTIPFVDMGTPTKLTGSNPKVGFSANNSLVAGLAGAATLLGKMYDHSTLPPTQHGNGNGDLMYQSDLKGFAIYHKSITAQYAQRIDSYFTMFGYKQNKAGIPNLYARPKWVYVKTAGASIHGNIQSSDIAEIEAIYDKGIRFWHYLDTTFGDYSQNNSPTH